MSRNWEHVPYRWCGCEGQTCPHKAAHDEELRRKKRAFQERMWWSFLVVILICVVLLSACADFSIASRNNSGTTTACVDRDLRDGDSCAPSPVPQDAKTQVSVSP